MESARLMPMDGYKRDVHVATLRLISIRPRAALLSRYTLRKLPYLINIMRVLHATVAVHRGRKARELPHPLMPAIAHLPTDIR